MALKFDTAVLTLTALALLALPSEGMAGSKAKKDKKGKKNVAQNADDLMVVDCLLKPKVRRIGRNSSYMAPRLPVRTTAIDCRIRGGEYTEPDEATFATSLRVWLPQARSGDVEAMFYVGQIYERGLGTDPDYSSAAEWYQKASKKDYAPAMVNLGYLYEVGLGVEADKERALSLYRRAAGGEDDLVVLAEEDLAQLEQELADRSREVASLGDEVQNLTGQLAELDRAVAQSEELKAAEVAKLEAALGQKQKQLMASQGRLAELQQETAGSSSVAAGASAGSKLDFGKYYALVVGNSNYEHLPKIDRGVTDAERVASALESKYGYEVRLETDASRYDIMTAINDLRQKITEKDNLLVYYAGHGVRDDRRNLAYWQPIDAKEDSKVNWIASSVLADHLDLVAAKHVMVVADSAFSGMRTRSSIAKLSVGQTAEQRTLHIKRLLEKRSRLIMASGVASNTRNQGDGPSFSDAFLSALSDNGRVLEGVGALSGSHRADAQHGGRRLRTSAVRHHEMDAQRRGGVFLRAQEVGL